MAKSLVVDDFGSGKCDSCDLEKDELASITFSDDMQEATTTYTFCEQCLENAIGTVFNEGKETQLLGTRASNE